MAKSNVLCIYRHTEIVPASRGVMALDVMKTSYEKFVAYYDAYSPDDGGTAASPDLVCLAAREEVK